MSVLCLPVHPNSRIQRFPPGGEVFLYPGFFRVVYRRGKYLQKAAPFTVQTLRRLRLVAKRNDHDLFFVYRGAFPVGPPLIALTLARIPGHPLVYDFDDAIFLQNASTANRVVASLKYPQKVQRIIRASDHVVAGNRYLAEFACGRSRAVTVIPTCVDTTKFVPRVGSRVPRAGQPVVGWIGSPTTVPYLLSLREVLRRVARSHRFTLRVYGAGRAVNFPGVAVANVPWSLEREVSLFNTCDIGVYPLWDYAWTRGKYGFKAIQFMPCGVPVVAAAVGVNREIIQEGVNGFLAASEEEWREKLGLLLSDARLRDELGQTGRRTVEERYDVPVHAPRLLGALREAVERRARGSEFSVTC